jgi:phage anti-repressor protein
MNILNKNNYTIPETINFTALVQSSNTTLSLNLQQRMIQILNEKFTEKEQKWYVANLYMYLHYDSTTDYPINLEDVFKMIGFANKSNAKRTLKNNFTLDEDYKITVLPRDDGKFSEETIMLNIDTFKSFCLLTKTPEGKQIRRYYVKLENITNQLTKEELQNNELLLKEKEREIEEKDKLIEEFENKPDTEGFHREAGEVYCIIDTTKKGHVKIGMSYKSISRVGGLNVGSSTQSLKLYTKFDTFDKVFAEKLIHSCLNPFRIKNRNEWFYFKNDLEMAYAMNTIKKCLDYIKSFDIKDYNHFKDITTDLNIQNELLDSEMSDESKKLHDEELEKYKETITLRNIHACQHSCAKSGNFKGTSFNEKSQTWQSKIQYKYQHIYLGDYSSEVLAAMAYNQHALFLNKTEKTDYTLNDIVGYETIPLNIVEYNQKNALEKKSSKYKGVSFDTRKHHYTASIKLSGKSYCLGSDVNEIECAKNYNIQAAYFNNTVESKYKLNDIPDFITVPRNLYQELQDNKKKNKNKYTGVHFKINKWVASYSLNNKTIYIGRYDTELEACQEYNKAVAKLNEHGCNYKINEIDTV